MAAGFRRARGAEGRLARRVAGSRAPVPLATDLGQLTFSPGGEEWIEYGPPEDRRRVGFHDYATLYAVPGLYDRVFLEELGMCSAEVVVELLGEGLRALGRDGREERVLDFGAGSGLGGALLRRELGIGGVVGLDVEPEAARAAERERPGVYDDYLVADLASAPATYDELAAHRFTALVAVSAIGVGHIPLELLADTIERLVPRGGLFAFAVADQLLPGFLDELLARVGAERLGTRSYVHRRRVDGSPHDATAVVARLT